MTKVLMNIDLLEYQWYMKDALRQVIQKNFIGGIREAERVEPPLAHTVPKAAKRIRARASPSYGTTYPRKGSPSVRM